MTNGDLGQSHTGVIDKINSRRLATELYYDSNDPWELCRLFDQSLTTDRSVGEMTTQQRALIIALGQSRQLVDAATSGAVDVVSPLESLIRRISDGRDTQPVGYNFFIVAASFLEGQNDWANHLNACLIQEHGVNLRDIANAQADDYGSFNNLLKRLIQKSRIQTQVAFAYYIAGKSKAGETFLEKEYGDILNDSKYSVIRNLDDLSIGMGLSPDMVQRAREQIKRACFGAFDHLSSMVTMAETDTIANYQPGTLRIQMSYSGSINDPSPQLIKGPMARKSIEHELNHVSSVQTNRKIGLQLLDRQKGIDVNEAMTNFLAERALDFPGFPHERGGTIERPRGYLTYPKQTTAMLMLFSTDQANFATLFRAYHGDISNPNQLERALDAFYAILS